MNIECSICKFLLTPSSDIFMTPCGHVFHFPCLVQWLDNSPTCPHCRHSTKRDKVTRIYFTFVNNDGVNPEDSFTLSEKLLNLECQLNTKKTLVKTISEENHTLKKQNAGLRDEVRKCESKINEKNSAIHALKEQSSYFKQQCQDLENVQKENSKLQSKLEQYDNMRMLLAGVSEDVDIMLSRTTDINTLATYVAIMKRELSTCVNKRKELRNSVKRLQQDIQSMKMERNKVTEEYEKKIESLEEALAICESDRDHLKMQLESNGTKDEESRNKSVEDSESTSKRPAKKSSLKRDSSLIFDTEGAKTKKIKRQNDDDMEIMFSSPVVAQKAKTQKKENEENSPYLPTKSNSILGLKDRSRSALSLGSKRNLLGKHKSDSTLKNVEGKEIAFDGFGGHAKEEIFPAPKSSPSKYKRSIIDYSKNKKIKLDMNKKPMDDFVINLT